jgi:hypothetical protein
VEYVIDGVKFFLTAFAWLTIISLVYAFFLWIRNKFL